MLYLTMFKIANIILAINILLAILSCILYDKNEIVNRLNEIFMLLTIVTSFLTAWMWVFNI